MSNVAMAPADLRNRTLEFSREVIRFCSTVDRNSINNPIINQLIRSSSSIGANFVEAKNASSKRDFKNKVYISKKEASETIYWLQLCEELVNADDLKKLQNECQEIVLILQSIINKLNH